MTPDLEDTLAYAPYARSSKERLVIYKKAVADFKKNYKKVMAERKKAEKEKAEAES